MEVLSPAFRRTVRDHSTGLAFAFLLLVWIPVSEGWLVEPLYAILYPVWLPGYLAVLGASAVRNLYLPWLGSGLSFYTIALALLFLEAALVARLLRFVAWAYRARRGGGGNGGNRGHDKRNDGPVA
ncbi:hypothetical protein [Haloprofundus salinisoli]|uniref:hypothetical protein n=1 Tax=Haloprofundus salinisoli TaxID=2876193 RepID=UPI001CCC1D3A|nr:hypothetical protein [Haloprofundus salinisoli]